MSNLPNPKEFKSFELQLCKVVKFDNSTNENKKEILLRVYNAMNKNIVNPSSIYNILNKRFLDTIDETIQQKVIKKYLRNDTVNNSPSIILENERNTLQAISIHKAKDGTKWKKITGSNTKYVHYRISNFIVFVAYGMGEMLTLELLGLSYILFQSDRITNTLETNTQWNEEVRPKLKNKLLVMLLDNDVSCLSTIQNLNENLKGVVKMCLPIQMIDLITTSAFFNDIENRASQQAREIWKSRQIIDEKYDFKDFVLNEYNPENVKDIVMKTIENKIKGIL